MGDLLFPIIDISFHVSIAWVLVTFIKAIGGKYSGN
jgi:hypothetical protein